MNKRLIVLQDGNKDCGNAALLSIIRFYGGDIPISKLVEMNNTTKEGTNFLNLKYTALQIASKLLQPNQLTYFYILLFLQLHLKVQF